MVRVWVRSYLCMSRSPLRERRDASAGRMEDLVGVNIEEVGLIGVSNIEELGLIGVSNIEEVGLIGYLAARRRYNPQ
jgi:hypothetical protein